MPSHRRLYYQQSTEQHCQFSAATSASEITTTPTCYLPSDCVGVCFVFTGSLVYKHWSLEFTMCSTYTRRYTPKTNTPETWHTWDSQSTQHTWDSAHLTFSLLNTPETQSTQHTWDSTHLWLTVYPTHLRLSTPDIQSTQQTWDSTHLTLDTPETQSTQHTWDSTHLRLSLLNTPETQHTWHSTHLRLSLLNTPETQHTWHSAHRTLSTPETQSTQHTRDLTHLTLNTPETPCRTSSASAVSPASSAHALVPVDSVAPEGSQSDDTTSHLLPTDCKAVFY